MNILIKTSVLGILYASMFGIVADDTDILAKTQANEPNVLFVLDMSGSMMWGVPDAWPNPPLPIAQQRITMLKDAFKAVIGDPEIVNINVGVATFSGSHGTDGPMGGMLNTVAWNVTANGISFPVSPIDGDATSVLNQNSAFTHSELTGFSSTPPFAATSGNSYVPDPLTTGDSVRTFLSSNFTDNWVVGGGTPVTDALYEAVLYFRGEPVRLGSYPSTSRRAAHPSTYTSGQLFTQLPVTNPTNTPPGDPNITYNSPISRCSDNSIILMTDGQATVRNVSATTISQLMGQRCAATTNASELCGRELATFMSTQDQSVGVNGFEDTQTIKLHTVKLLTQDATAISYLQSLATLGGGTYSDANNTTELTDVFKAIISSLGSGVSSFESPTYTAAGSSSVGHSDEVYLPIFEGDGSPRWSGNLKKFKRQSGVLKDANGDIATDASGQILKTAKDYWADSAATMSHAVKSGGFANKIDPVRRKSGATPVYTDNGSSGVGASLISLNSSLNNSLFDDNNSSTSVDTAYKTKLVNFILGEASDGTARHHMGDILHSKPIFVSYGSQKVLYVGTNEGYLHAINESSGEEIFAFMPSKLLKNIDAQYRNNSDDKHKYGVDGPITFWHDDTNHNGDVDSGETAILYFGLRRGGKAYYALDISDRTHPSLKWVINNTGLFSNLGYTWSQPTLSMFRYDSSSTARPVLVFGGGFIDDNGDYVTETEGSTSTGTEVYIVNALTGAQIWKTSDTAGSMATKFPKAAKIRVIDLNRDGSLDRLYYSDTGGNIWRADFNTASLSDARVIHFANLAGSSSSGRKFFVEPDVAIFKKHGKVIASVAIGSGERPKPLGTTRTDYFFVLFDEEITNVTTTPATILMGDLLNASNGPVNVFTANKKGWYQDLVLIPAEKVLSSAITFEGTVFFGSFGLSPSGSNNVCKQGSSSKTRLYALDLLTGGAVLDFEGNGVPVKSTEGTEGDIPGTPQILFNQPSSSSGGNCGTSDCVRKKEVALGKGRSIALPDNNELKRVYWIDED